MIDLHGYTFTYTGTPLSLEGLNILDTAIGLTLLIGIYIGWYILAIILRRWRVVRDKREKKRTIKELVIMKEIQTELEHEIEEELKESIR